MHDKIDAIFGRDILPILGIHLTGVATNWDDNKVKFDDSIEDSEYIPNVSNAGTPDEHEALLLTLQSHIDKNQQIDVHSLWLRFADETFARKLDKIIGVT
ncbi:hypothetical protein G6F57_022865 [Rhizopus arrhizus]|nr:hypothetical protein G6F28_013942 [Rhizopus arrhizus]KAG1053630.1 hypothetical protein G6F41_014232 [Rhizopus arrhizus]KAG1432164.1 hypothetical protein G6F57_022865 [Rhizopus arrhizus]